MVSFRIRIRHSFEVRVCVEFIIRFSLEFGQGLGLGSSLWLVLV